MTTLEKDIKRITELEQERKTITAELNQLKRKHGIGIYCCKTSEHSNGWSHSPKCKNWTLTY